MTCVGGTPTWARRTCARWPGSRPPPHGRGHLAPRTLLRVPVPAQPNPAYRDVIAHVCRAPQCLAQGVCRRACPSSSVTIPAPGTVTRRGLRRRRRRPDGAGSPAVACGCCLKDAGPDAGAGAGFPAAACGCCLEDGAPAVCAGRCCPIAPALALFVVAVSLRTPRPRGRGGGGRCQPRRRTVTGAAPPPAPGPAVPGPAALRPRPGEHYQL